MKVPEEHDCPDMDWWEKVDHLSEISLELLIARAEALLRLRVRKREKQEVKRVVNSL